MKAGIFLEDEKIKWDRAGFLEGLVLINEYSN
jgi:hypothetical protein